MPKLGWYPGLDRIIAWPHTPAAPNARSGIILSCYIPYMTLPTIYTPIPRPIPLSLPSTGSISSRAAKMTNIKTVELKPFTDQKPGT